MTTSITKEITIEPEPVRKRELIVDMDAKNFEAEIKIMTDSGELLIENIKAASRPWHRLSSLPIPKMRRSMTSGSRSRLTALVLKLPTSA